jgi:hypothetical protein
MKKRDLFGELNVRGRIILKWNLKIWGGRVWNEFIWPKE